jgi:predicted nucleotidyltransferase
VGHVPAAGPGDTAGAIVERPRRVAERHGCVEFATLFGSADTGRRHAHSDVDVAVYLREVCDLLEFLASFSADALGASDVDVLILNGDLPYELRHRALAGRLVYARDRERYVEEVVRAASLWDDLR